ncbi:MAG TPA: hypothetical protein VNO30_20545 [Kofleriaceae bacterium]|nr:hypothetical protein [Kofleriaceae bacterium]
MIATRSVVRARATGAITAIAAATAAVAAVAAALVAAPRAAAAAPAADVVIVWAPEHDTAPLAAAARAAGAALIDRSPRAVAAEPPDAAIRRGIDSYEALQLDRAWAIFEEVRASLDRTGAAAATPARLSDLFIYRGAIRTQRGDAEGAWEELVAAMVVAPARVLDPARFPPRTIEELERARRAATARPRVAVSIEAPADCALTVDGAGVAQRELQLSAGAHWVAAACPGAAPWGARVDAVEPAARVRVSAAPLEPPPEAEALVQARAGGASGLVLAEVRGRIATLRRLGLDGRERDRRTVAVAAPAPGALAPLGEALRDVLRPAPRARWYQSRWVWAAGAAGLATAIVLPLALGLSDDAPRGVTIVGPGALP